MLFCFNPRHFDEPCPQPCVACDIECAPEEAQEKICWLDEDDDLEFGETREEQWYEMGISDADPGL